ncbi:MULTISPECIES: alkaline phosphatase D family protein [unclassified Paraflavitalea]|uniref:alkaline phosphatase D family protein n=1 Tax=unclassified Paraflavitalea TaxID=2798305 RepID=UPI003D35616A
MVRFRLFPSIFTFLLLFLINTADAQLVSGPMLGHTELRTAKIWVELVPGSTATIVVKSTKDGKEVFKTSETTGKSSWYAPVTFDVVGLDMNTSYDYEVLVTGVGEKKPVVAGKGTFTTSELWQWRKPAPDFSFLAGSCAYFNEPQYDRPGKPYGGDSSIFETMAKEKAGFMLWLGDNWYLREPDYFSKWGIWYRAHRDRSMPILKDFLKAMPQYAIWDDHDYGSNDADKSFSLKEESRKVFTNYWANAAYGFNGEGIYSRMSQNDCDFFLMDDRTYRSSDDMTPTVYGKPNPNKRMWGPTQMEWLKNALLNSKAPFKFIVTGSQTLNPASPFDCLQDYPVEFEELMAFLDAENISGVVFLTGDRHHSEVIKYARKDKYPLFDITSSPLTSGIGRVFGTEKDNPARIANTLVEAQNYTRITISGKTGERIMKVEFVSIKGEVMGTWSISEKELKNK